MTRQYWQEYLQRKTTEKGMYFPRQGAKDLGISEAELLLTHPNATYLGNDIKPIVLALKNLGNVKCIVRNNSAVHEKIGIYENVSMTRTTGIALNVGALDLRIFASHWHHALALEEMKNDTPQYSIQFFDEYGDAIQKIFMRDNSQSEAWHKIVDEWRSPDHPSFAAKMPKQGASIVPLSAERKAAFQERWMELKDVHHFGGILETFEIDRRYAFENAPEGMTCRVSREIFKDIFQVASEKAMEVMIFVGNRGIVQIQTGKIHHLDERAGWLNIFDEKEENFTLHLEEKMIDDAWIVRRPTRDGIITCVEGFDSDGHTVVQVFGRRQEGDPEMSQWQQMTQERMQ